MPIAVIMILTLCYPLIGFAFSLFILNAGPRRAAPNDETWEILASVFWPLTIVFLLGILVFDLVRWFGKLVFRVVL